MFSLPCPCRRPALRLSKGSRFFKKLGVSPVRIIKEFESQDNSEYQIGQEIKVDIFKPGDFIDASAISQGKGFQGGMKRWNWIGGPAGHGSMHHRRVGSIGLCQDPGHVFKGQIMPGHMGDKRRTVQNLKVVKVYEDKNLVLIKGSTPGFNGSQVVIRTAKKTRVAKA